MQNFTDATIRSLKPGTYFDPKTPAFGIRIGKRRKTWIVLRGPRERRVQSILGHYPSMTLSEARQSAYGVLARPHDPKPIPPFPDALEACLAQDRWKPATLYKVRSSLKHFTWTKGIDKITHHDVAEALDQIQGPSARAHALKDLRAFFNWTVPRYLSSSPCQGINAPGYKPRERVLNDDELKRVWVAAEQMRTFGAIVRLLILTGARRGEIASLKWEWIQEDRITLPKEITKNGREHTFPLGSLASLLLRRFGPTTRTGQPSVMGLCFGASTSSEVPYNGWGKHHRQLLEKSETSNWTIHDLRRTFATGLASLGVAIHVTEKLLNHVSGSTAGIVGVYQKHAYWEEQKSAIQKWEAKIEALVRNGHQETSS